MNYSSIILFDVANGQGIRVSLFVSGCKFHCEGCFNKECQEFDHGSLFTGEQASMILDRIKRPEFSGLSLLGGDPMWQDVDGLKQLIELCDEVHHLGKDVWLWTGFTYEELIDGDNTSESFMRRVLLDNIDVLIDGQFILNKRDLGLAWRGSSNQRIIDMKKTKLKGNVVLLDSVK